MKLKQTLCLFLSTLFLSGCGYHLSSGNLNTQACKTVSVPYIEGDLEGDFTSTLVHKLAASGKWKYRTNQADLMLKVTLAETRNEEVGYSYSIQNGQINKWLVPNENRLSGLVKVELVETATQKIILGPEYLSASVRYDYDADFNVNNLVRFSLAQYNFQEIASRSAKIPLDERLANTIIEYLENAW